MIIETYPTGTAVKIMHGSCCGRIGLVLSSKEVRARRWRSQTYHEIMYKVLIGDNTIRFYSNVSVEKL